MSVEWRGASDGIGCLGYVVLLAAAPLVFLLVQRTAGVALAAAAFAMFRISRILRDRHARRPPRPMGERAGTAYRDEGALVACARDHFERRWKAPCFEVIAQRASGDQVVLEIEIGSPRAFATVVMRARDGWLVDLTLTPKPGFEGVVLTDDEAIAIAREERGSFRWVNEPRAWRTGELVVVSAHAPESLRGGGVRIDIHASSGVVSAKKYVMR